MRKIIPSLCLLLTLGLVAGGCWPWERTPPPPQTPLPTTTPPKVEEADQSSPSIEGRLLYAGDGHIWLRSGTTAHRLTEGTEGLQSTQPCWSPNGTKIAFIVQGEGYSDIWVMDADGGKPQAITDNRSDQPEYSRESVYSSFWAFQPHWIGPDGEWIGYISHSYPQSSHSLMSIWRIHPDGTEEKRYLARSGNVENPTWSPNGGMLIFTLYTYDNGPQLRYYDPLDDVTRTLGEDVEGLERYDPAWSPDGKWVAYAARQGGKTDLWVIPSPLNALYEGEWSPTRLTEQGMARGPAWSPDGRQIVFVAAQDDSFDLWLLHLEFGHLPQGVQVEQLTQDLHVDATARPCWTR